MVKPAQALLLEAMAAEARGQRALLAGNAAAGEAEMRVAADRYRASWEAAPPAAYGRLVGMLKAAVIAGGARAEAAYARAELAAAGASPRCSRSELARPSLLGPTASYALAIAALVLGDDDGARAAAARMRDGSGPFARAADAVSALADGDGPAYAAAIAAIVADFAAREDHLTGVPIADTALMLERLAAPRGLAARPQTPLLPT